MKLKKPIYSKNANDLQDYVSNLLLENVSEPDSYRTISNVTSLKMDKKRGIYAQIKSDLTDTVSGTVSDSGLDGEIDNSLEATTVSSNNSSTNERDKPEIAKKTTTSSSQVDMNQTATANIQKHSGQVTRKFKEHEKLSFASTSEDETRLQNVEKLLAKISLANLSDANTDHELLTDKKIQNVVLEESSIGEDPKTDIDSKLDSDVVIISEQEEQQLIQNTRTSFQVREHKPLKDVLGSVFQTLVFEVNNLPLAVPLIKLGGIVDISQQNITPLVGTPDWFLGLAPNERGNLMVVDTQRFLMPEKIPVEKRAYRYLIVLDDSQWALACHSVGDAKNLSPEDIRWSSRSSKRPWFAGMVIEYMSAILEVDELINLLSENITE